MVKSSRCQPARFYFLHFNYICVILHNERYSGKKLHQMIVHATYPEKQEVLPCI